MPSLILPCSKTSLELSYLLLHGIDLISLIDYGFRYIKIILIKRILLSDDGQEEESRYLPYALLDEDLDGITRKKLIRLYFVVIGDIFDRIIELIARTAGSTMSGLIGERQRYLIGTAALYLVPYLLHYPGNIYILSHK